MTAILPSELWLKIFAINGDYYILNKDMWRKKILWFIYYCEYHDKEERQALFFSSINLGLIDVVKAIYKYIDVTSHHNKYINWAITYNHLEVVKFLSTLPGVDASACNNNAICLASKYGHLEVVKFLSTLPGVDASAFNNIAICWASLHGHLEVVKFLSTLPGVDASACNNNAICLASKYGHLEVVKFLLTLPVVI